MRYRPGHKEEARARMIAATGRGFRKHGYGGIGVDGLAKEANATSGTFYGYFPTKKAAFKEAVVAGIDELRAGVQAFREAHGPEWLEAFVDFYLSAKRVCDLSESCAMQTLTPEVGRSDAEIKAAFEARIAIVSNLVADGLPGTPADDRSDRAWALLAMLSGGVTLARAVQNEKVAKTIADAVKRAAVALATGSSDKTKPRD